MRSLKKIIRKNTFGINRSNTGKFLHNLRFSPYFYIVKKWSIMLFQESLRVLSLHQKLIGVATGINQISNIQLKTESIQIPFENRKIRYQSTSNFSNIRSLMKIKEEIKNRFFEMLPVSNPNLSYENRPKKLGELNLILVKTLKSG